MAKKLNGEERDTLNELYTVANKSNLELDWLQIDVFHAEMAKKYNYDVKKHVITTKGDIQVAYICHRCGGTANRVGGIIWDRTAFNNEDERKMPICYHCFCIKYPHKINKRLKQLQKKNVKRI